MAEKIRKPTNIFEELNRKSKRFDESHPIQAVQWWVGEKTEDTKDEYGSWSGGQNYGRTSPYFDTEEEMNQWMSEYKPTHGKFYVRKRYLRLVPEHTEWYDY